METFSISWPRPEGAEERPGVGKPPRHEPSEIHRQIDQLVYQLYGLTAEEIGIVGDSAK